MAYATNDPPVHVLDTMILRCTPQSRHFGAQAVLFQLVDFHSFDFKLDFESNVSRLLL